MIAKDIKEFHKLVCERDGYVCQICHKSFDYECHFNENGDNVMVCGHHIYRRNIAPQLTLETDNGITICKEDHLDVHKGIKHESKEHWDRAIRALKAYGN